MKGKQMTRLAEKLIALPKQPGVYLFKDKLGKILYVGKAKNLRNRVRSYFQSLDLKTNAWLKDLVLRIADMEIITTRSEKEALILECNLIKMHRPTFNIRFKDDKGYPFLKVTVNETYPAVIITRQPKEDGARYFGPYPDGKAFWQTVYLLKKLFGVRVMTIVNDRRKNGCPWHDTSKFLPRPCFEFHLLRCSGPCINAVDRKEYFLSAERLCAFLEGKTKEIVNQIEQEMWEAAQNEQFEKASKLRDQIHAIRKAMEKQTVMLSIKDDIDVYALTEQMGLGCIQIVSVRNGMLVDKKHFLLRLKEGQSAKNVLGEFVKQRYASGVPVPKIVLLPVKLDDSKVISEWISEKKGRTVTVKTPIRGVLRDLMDITERNAIQALKEELQREKKDRQQIRYALRSLQTHLNLPKPPKRIECYDISTIGGTETVGAMVVFDHGKPNKNEYRRFKVNIQTHDDYASMREVLSRRFQRYLDKDNKFSALPDLLLVDGGKGQLSIATDVLKKFGLNIPTAALAKEHELLYVPKFKHPITLSFNSPALHLLQRIRDETHRYAVTFHRKRRDKRMTQTILDEVYGIGKVRKKSLLQQFGSLDALMQASEEDLAKVPYMNRTVAKSLWHFLHYEVNKNLVR